VLSKQGDKLAAELELQLRDKGKRAEAISRLGYLADHLHFRDENPKLVKRVIKLLLPYFKDPDASIREIAVKQTPAHADSRSAIEHVLLNDDPAICKHAHAKLQSLGIDTEAMLQAKLKTATGRDRMRIAAAIAADASSWRRDIGILTKELKSEDAPTRREAVRLLLALGPPFEANESHALIVKVLMDDLKSDDKGRCEQAARGFDKLANTWSYRNPSFFISPPGPQVPRLEPELPPLLLPFVDDPSPVVRLHLLKAIGEHNFADDGRAHLKKLLPSLDEKDEDFRYHAVRVLAGVKELGVPHLARLAEKDASPKVSHQACRQLGELGVKAKAAVPALLRAAQDIERYEDASSTLIKVDSAGTFVRRLELVAGRDSRLEKAMGKIDPNETSSRLSEKLVRGLKDNDPFRRRDAAYALRAIMMLMGDAEHTEAGMSVLKALGDALAIVELEVESKDPKIRTQAMTTLVEYSRLESAITPSLVLLILREITREDYEANQKLFEQGQHLWPTFKKLIAAGRVDSELQVRRQARELHRIALHYYHDSRRFGGGGFGTGPGGGPRGGGFGTGIRPGGFGNLPGDGFNLPPVLIPPQKIRPR
jgi:HEAT repeat protein